MDMGHRLASISSATASLRIELSEQQSSSQPPQPKPNVLEYQTSGSHGPIPSPPKWVYAVVAIYLLLLLGLLAMPLWSVWALDASRDNMAPLGVCVVVLLLSGVSLMMVPVRAVSGRPTDRRSIWIPIVGSGLLMALLFLFAGFALSEYIDEKTSQVDSVAVGAACVWLMWTGVFIPMAFAFDPTSLGMKLHRLLFAGSLLELLVAVPCHIVVRRRPDCCAGIVTGMAICVGVAIMFVSLGPSVFLLFYRRRKQISNRR
jgi:hypothetical protein